MCFISSVQKQPEDSKEGPSTNFFDEDEDQEKEEDEGEEEEKAKEDEEEEEGPLEEEDKKDEAFVTPLPKKNPAFGLEIREEPQLASLTEYADYDKTLEEIVEEAKRKTREAEMERLTKSSVDSELLNSHFKDRIRLRDTLAICAVAFLVLRIPILLSDLRRWARNGKIPYFSAFYSLPKEMREKISPAQKSSLLTKVLTLPLT